MTAALAFAAELLGSPSRQHPDLHVIVPTPPESNPKGARAIRINAIRELERVAALKPVAARRKVFVLDEGERMTADTPQAFLKTLEEPPPATAIILILPRARAVPATILSRCQVVRFAARDDAGAAQARAQAREILAEAKAQGFEALFRRLDRVDREKAEALVDAYWLLCRGLLLARSGAGYVRSQRLKRAAVAKHVEALRSAADPRHREQALAERGTVVGGLGLTPHWHDVLPGSQLHRRARPGNVLLTCSHWASST